MRDSRPGAHTWIAVGLDLAQTLLQSHSTTEIVVAAGAFCADVTGRPTVAWITASDGAERRVGRWHARAADLRRSERALATPDPDLVVLRADDAALTVDGPSGEDAALVASAGDLMASALRQLDAIAVGERDVDVGLAMTAHELREPLLVARAALEQALSSTADVSKRLTSRTIEHLARLSDRVEHVLRWSAAGGTLEVRPVNVRGLVRAAARACTAELGGDTRIGVRAPEGLVVDADPDLLGVAVENLVRNAIQYSPPGSPVTVEVRHGTGVEIAVTDRGPGLSPVERPGVFDAFTRRSAGRLRSGTGLGLYVAQQVVLAHRGSIDFDPDSSGCGSVFTITLPEEAVCAS
jgi:signal transduction histidine kinase